MRLINGLVAVVVSMLALGVQAEEKKVAAAPGAVKVELKNVLQDGKKTWLPGEMKVKQGQHVEVTLENTLGEEHGFQIPGLVDPVVVGPKSKKTVSFEAKGEGEHPYSCQMHPAHVGGKLTITK